MTSPEAVSKLINDIGQSYAICNVEKISALSDNRSYQAWQEWTLLGANLGLTEGFGSGVAGKHNMTYIERISIETKDDSYEPFCWCSMSCEKNKAARTDPKTLQLPRFKRKRRPRGLETHPELASSSCIARLISFSARNISCNKPSMKSIVAMRQSMPLSSPPFMHSWLPSVLYPAPALPCPFISIVNRRYPILVCFL